jgi:hypothetical protein
MKNKKFSYEVMMNFKYSDIFRHNYTAYYQQEPDGSLTPTTREACFDFSDKKHRIRFFADPESGLCIRLTDNENGKSLERLCFRQSWNYAQRMKRGTEAKTVSVEDCRSNDDEETFTFDFPDPDINIEEEYEISAFESWLESQLNAEERGLYRAVKNGYTVNEYSKIVSAKNPDLKPNSVWRKYARLMPKLIAKAEKFRLEWDKL